MAQVEENTKGLTMALNQFRMAILQAIQNHHRVARRLQSQHPMATNVSSPSGHQNGGFRDRHHVPLFLAINTPTPQTVAPPTGVSATASPKVPNPAPLIIAPTAIHLAPSLGLSP